MAEEFTHLATTPEELKSARQVMDWLRFQQGGGFWSDKSGQLLFFPRWPFSRKAYVVPDEETAYRLRGVQRKVYQRDRGVSWAFISLTALLALFLWQPVDPSAFALALVACCTLLVTLQTLVGSALTSSMVRGLRQAPPSEEFSFWRRVERMAGQTSILRLSLGACLIGALMVACVGGLWFSATRAFDRHTHQLVLLFQATCLLIIALFFALLGLMAYEAWFLATHPKDRRQPV
jgi:hypothetical protein